MAIKYTNIFHCKTLQNLPKLGFFGLKICHLATPVSQRLAAMMRATATAAEY
jgi:hypothetical protein